MLIIPVIDIMGGLIVHASHGQRHLYQPINSCLSPDSMGHTIISGLLRLAPFTELYVADLDAIMEQGNNIKLIQKLKKLFPQVNFWIDAGTGTEQYCDQLGFHVIMSSESYPNLDAMKVLLKKNSHAILSLDFQGGLFLGNSELLHKSEIWPERIILMQLQHVGSNRGPDWSLAEQYCALDKQFFLAGGFRNSGDLERLKKFNLAGCLIASALHDNRISNDVISKYYP